MHIKTTTYGPSFSVSGCCHRVAGNWPEGLWQPVASASPHLELDPNKTKLILCTTTSGKTGFKDSSPNTRSASSTRRLVQSRKRDKYRRIVLPSLPDHWASSINKVFQLLRRVASSGVALGYHAYMTLCPLRHKSLTSSRKTRGIRYRGAVRVTCLTMLSYTATFPCCNATFVAR